MVIRLPLNLSRKPATAQRPLMLGIVGDSGSGKSTLIRGLVELFGPENVTEICLDDYHRYDRATRAKMGLTALNPAANNLRLMARQLGQLRTGKPVFKPVYDHSTGTFGPSEWVSPRRVIIVNGLFTLFNPELTRLFDLSIYLNPETELRLAWKIHRDTRKRGYTLAQVLQQIEERQADATAYIEPQQQRADWVVSFRRPVGSSIETKLDAHLYNRRNDTRLIVPANPVLGSLVVEALSYSTGDLVKSVPSTLGLYQSAEGEWQQSHSLAVTQLLIAESLVPERKLALQVA